MNKSQGFAHIKNFNLYDFQIFFTKSLAEWRIINDSLKAIIYSKFENVQNPSFIACDYAQCY